MKSHLIVIVFALLSFGRSTWALDIPKGTFYFDNSKTQYTHVQFVFGVNSSAASYVLDMTDEGNNIWSITIDERVKDQYRYTFSNTTIETGLHEQTFDDLKNYISNTLNCYRTSTTDKIIIVGGTYVPDSGNNWASGTWVAPGNYVASWSGTLPVLHINTDSGNEITSKDEYVTGTYWLDNLGLEGFGDSFGSKDEPLPLMIKGRGNYTWSSFNKKPYKIKLDEKAKLCGMKKAKRFALMANADDGLGGLRNDVGYELSRRLGMAFTPDSQPVELVINNDYRGLYFITEPVEVGANHVNITEQEDLATDSVDGGWLVEIDNYSSDGQVKFREGNGQNIQVTMKSPEELSTEQRDYITTELNSLNTMISTSEASSTDWEKRIDKSALARYYIIQEIMEDTESFHGSCFFYKDRGEDALWTWGPVWDFGNAFHRHQDKFIYDSPSFDQYWIGTMAKWNSFQTEVREVWKEFLEEKYSTLNDWIDERADIIYEASGYDGQRWPEYSHDISSCASNIKNNLEWRINWLRQQWGDYPSGIGDKGVLDIQDDASQPVYNLSGQRVNANAHGILIRNGRKFLSK